MALSRIENSAKNNLKNRQKNVQSRGKKASRLVSHRQILSRKSAFFSGKAKKRKNKPQPLNLSSWNTTDEQEIEHRRLLAQTEKFKYQALEPGYGYFGSFLVSSKQGQTQYQVEIRCLVEPINSCDCSDYLQNQLGTCKHIEYVLFRLQKNHKKLFKQIATEGSPRVEIYLDRRQGINTLTVQWPKKFKRAVFLKEQLKLFLKSDRILLSDWVEAYPQLQTLLAKNRAWQKRVRLSRHLEDVIETENLKKEQQAKNAIFLKELEQGKHSLNGLKLPLYPYQQQGMLHLVLNQRALLADEMGLGKTVQAVAACELLRRVYGLKKILVVASASLKAEWEEQIEKFTPLKSVLIYGSRSHRLKQYSEEAVFYLTNYEQIVSDGLEIQGLISPDIIILDEAQRIKNWQTKTAAAVKQLKSPYAFVLTGTPLENRIEDVYSLVQFLDPHLFGPLFRFNRDFYQIDDLGKPLGYKNLDELHRRLKNIMLRRCKNEIEDQLPERTIDHYFVPMEKEQRSRYEGYESRVTRLVFQAKSRPLRKEEHERLQRWLACMRMICDSPYILDPSCRISPKLKKLENILGELLQDKTVKIIIFSEWERMLKLVLELTQKHHWGAAWHTGSVPQPKRRAAIQRFKTNPDCPLFLSTDAGSLGLNLQVANVVINVDLPWNPAKLEQRIARAWRKHQTHTVRVLNLVCEQSIEQRMLGLLSQKKTLATGVLEGELKEMALPSGRQALIERLENLMPSSSKEEVDPAIATHSTEDSVEPADKTLDHFQQQVNAWIQQVVNSTEEKPTKMLLVVPKVEKNSKIGTPDLIESPPSDALERIDRNTWAIIQRLEKSGHLTLNTDIKIVNDQHSLPQTFIPENRRHKATESLIYAIRKDSLARLLLEQGFYEESVLAFQTSLDSAIEAFSWLFMEFSKDKMTQEFMQGSLIARYDLPKKTLILWQHMKKETKEFSQAFLSNFAAEYQEILQHIQKRITQLLSSNELEKTFNQNHKGKP